MITQEEIERYLWQAEIGKQHTKLRADLTNRLEQGATVEPGKFTAAIEVEAVRRYSRTAIERVVGKKQAQDIHKRIEATKCRRLRIKDPQGKFCGWHTGLN